MQLSAEQTGQLVAARRRVLAALMSIHARRKQAVLGMGFALLQGSLVRYRRLSSPGCCAPASNRSTHISSILLGVSKDLSEVVSP